MAIGSHRALPISAAPLTSLRGHGLLAPGKCWRDEEMQTEGAGQGNKVFHG